MRFIDLLVTFFSSVYRVFWVKRLEGQKAWKLGSLEARKLGRLKASQLGG
jgi:hypothetical protein